jgi:phosphatidylinositol glycan class B
VSPLVRRHLAVTLAVTVVTGYFSYAYFHVDEYFQVLELTRKKLDPASVSVLPWEHTERMRPWLQPFVYWTIARAVGLLGVHDIFDLALAFRWITGLLNVGALALYLRTTLPWLASDEERLLTVRVACLCGFLPYLFVRTSSEAASMAALTAAWALILEGATPTVGNMRLWSVPALERPARVALAGLLFGIAFEMRFQTAFVPLSLAAWLVFTSRREPHLRRGLVLLGASGAFALVIGALVDRWGYGAWTFPPWSYFRANLLEGAAVRYGTDPPFGYLWMLPANVFFPVVVTLLVLTFVAWARWPWHPLTWSTVPFFVIHNVLSHKEERFLFPLAILSTGFVALAIRPSQASNASRLASLADRVARWGWERRRAWPAKALVVWSTAGMVLLALFPLGWNHDVRFVRALHDRFGDEVHATALPEIDMNLPPFHPLVWDLDQATPGEIARRIAEGTAREWLVAALPVLPPELDAHATLVYSELPLSADPGSRARAMSLVAAYNAHAGPPLRRLRFYSLYRVDVSARRSASP